MNLSTPVLLTTAADLPDLGGTSLLDDHAAEIPREACDVCPHPRASHDAIAVRFCSATGDGAIARGCVCRS